MSHQRGNPSRYDKTNKNLLYSHYPSAKLGGSIAGSNQHAKFQFPSRADYEAYFLGRGMINSGDELWKNSKLVADLQRHWHSRGQNGCVFAQMTAAKSAEKGWASYVVNLPAKELAGEAETISKLFQETIAVPELQLLSLLFPKVNSLDELLELVKQFVALFGFTTVEYPLGDLIGVGLRYALQEGDLSSWLVGFGPFDFFPFTRQAPVTELVFRGKEKPEKMFHRLNQERSQVHLADVPLDVEDVVAEKLWQSTYAKTRMLLGGDEARTTNILATAKVTFSVPLELWRSHNL
jgi:hypothetical protein